MLGPAYDTVAGPPMFSVAAISHASLQIYQRQVQSFWKTSACVILVIIFSRVGWWGRVIAVVILGVKVSHDDGFGACS